MPSHTVDRMMATRHMEAVALRRRADQLRAEARMLETRAQLLEEVIAK